MKHLLVTAICAGIALPAAAQSSDTRPSLWEYITGERIMQALVQTGVMALRSQVDLTYGHISGDLLAGQVALSDVTLWPEMPWDRDRNCRVSATRMVLSGAPITKWDHRTLKIDMLGVRADSACIPPQPRAILGSIGYKSIDVDRLFATFDYRPGPSSLDVALHANLPSAGVLDVTAFMDYAWIDNLDGSDPVPVVSLASAEATFEDAGLRQRATPLLPQELRDPNTAALVLTTNLSQALAQASGGSLNEAQSAFIDSAGTEVTRFLTEGGRIAVNITPQKSVWLNEDSVQNVGQLFADLQPLVGHGSKRQRSVLPPEVLSTALSEPDKLTPAQRLAAGTALTTGIGAPRSVERGRQLLQPLAATGNPEAAMQAATALQDSDPTTAYAFAVAAGASGAEHALGLIDRIEGRISTADALAAQNNVLKSWRDNTISAALRSGDLNALRVLTLQYLTGDGAPRSYVRAYLLATVAAAAGDAGGISLRDELDQRMRLRGPDASEAWANAAASAEKKAMEIWVQNGLAKQFAVK
ncbi:MAG: hypothetical protein ACE5FS_05265 [Paracoccaceae bacterium]